MTKHIAVYLRVSTEGAKNGKTQSTEMQRLEIENYLKAKGITEFQIYEDLGISGTKRDRPDLKRMMDNCRSGKVSMVIIYKLDRLFRSLKDLMETVTEFDSLDVKFVSVKDSIDMSTAAGRLLFQVLGAFAEFEAATIKERINSGIANARSKGIKLGRPKKAGHSVVRELKAKGKTVQEISLHTGLSRDTVYKELKKNGTIVQ